MMQRLIRRSMSASLVSFRTLAVAASLTPLLAGAAMAQSAIPSTVEPGHILPDLERQTQQPQVAPPVEVVTTPEAQAPAGAEKVVFTLKDVQVIGNGQISRDEMARYWQDSIGQQINLTKVYDIAAQITRLYRDRGYLLSRAVVPEQEIKDGTVKIQIVEGFVSNYVIQGKEQAGRKQIEAYAKQIVGTGPLQAADLERYLLLMNDIPGITVRAILSPSVSTPGGADLTLVPTRREFQGYASIDNYGSSYLGPLRISGTFQYNNIANLADSLSVTGLMAPQGNELDYVASSYRHVVDSEGTRLGFDVNYTRADPSLPLPLDALDTIGQAYTVRAVADHPFIRQRGINLTGQASFEVTQDSTYYAHAFNALETQDDLRVFRATANGNYLDTVGGYSTLSLQGSKGVEGLGSTKITDTNKSRAKGDPAFTKIAAEATRLQRIWGPFSALVGVTGQYAFDPLLSSEEFALGGTDYGRGYDPSEITGDHGIGGKFELTYNGDGFKYAKGYQIYTFYDVGTVWRKQPGAGENRNDSIASAGVGSRVNFTDALHGEVFAAKPLTAGVPSRGRSNENDWRVQGALTTNF